MIPTPAEQRNSSLSSIDPATRWAQYRKHGGTGHHHYTLPSEHGIPIYKRTQLYVHQQKVGRISNFRQENYGAAFFGKRHDAAAASRRVTRYGCFALQRRKAHSVFYYRQSQKISPLLLLLVWSKARLCGGGAAHNSSHAAQAVRSNHDTHFA